jgi:CheY-like chemotaxis protein
LAHDFNNLLTVILGYSASLLQDLPESDPAHLGLTQIRKAAGKGAELTHRLLAFGRRQMLRPEVLNLNPLIADAEHMVRHLVGDDIRVATQLDPALWRVRLDGASFHQILMNLAANARDAMPQGGAITVTTANVPMSASTTPASPLTPGDYVRITVSDTGTGLSEAARTHLFEPFFTTKDKGTGLGLSTVYGIVQQSGGQIFVDSKPQVGTTFRIYFPRAEGAEPEPLAAAAPSVTQRGTETVLLVEDREDVRQLVALTLRSLGYTVLEAEGSTMALELAQNRQQAIHLLLTDLAMPDMNGFELADHIVVYREGIRILFMSGFADTPHIGAEVSQPGRAFLQKPFTPDALATAVRDVMDEK